MKNRFVSFFSGVWGVRYDVYAFVLNFLFLLMGRERLLYLFCKNDSGFLKVFSGFFLYHENGIGGNACLASYRRVWKGGYINYKVGDWRLRHRLYDTYTESCLMKASEASFEISANFRYFDFLSQKYGYSSKKIKPLTKKLCLPRYKCFLNKRRELRLAMSLYGLGLEKDAERLVKNLGLSYLVENQRIFLLYNVFNKSIYSDPIIKRGYDLYCYLMSNKKDFESYLKINKGGIAIVGNAPSELGKGRGAEIDGAKIVVRINNYALNYPDDYGSKESVWVRVANGEVVSSREYSNEYTLIASNNFVVNRQDFFGVLVRPYIMGNKVVVVPPEIYQELIDRLCGLPSTGLLIIYWVYKVVGSLPRSSIYGFTHFCDGGDFKAHYFKDKESERAHLHEWERERDVLLSITY